MLYEEQQWSDETTPPALGQATPADGSLLAVVKLGHGCHIGRAGTLEKTKEMMDEEISTFCSLGWGTEAGLGFGRRVGMSVWLIYSCTPLLPPPVA